MRRSEWYFDLMDELDYDPAGWTMALNDDDTYSGGIDRTRYRGDHYLILYMER